MSCEHVYKLTDHQYEDHAGYSFPCQKCGEFLRVDVHTWDEVLDAFGVSDDDYD